MSLFHFIRDNIRWLLVGVLLTFISSFGQTYFISIFAGEIQSEFGLSHGEWGGIYFWGTMASGLLMIWAGGLADDFRVRTLAVVVILTLVMICLAMSQISAAWMLPFIIFGLRFTGQGMVSHIAIVAMARWYVRARGKAIAVAGAGYSLGEALMPMIFVSLLTNHDWRSLWILAATIAALAVPLLIWLLQLERIPASVSEREDSAGMRGQHWARKQVIRDWRFWGLVPAATLTGIFGTALFFLQVHLAEAKEVLHSDIVQLFPLYTVVTILSAIGAGLAIDRWGAIQLVPFVPLPMAAGFAVMGLSDGIGLLALGFVFVGMSAGSHSAVSGAYWAEIYGTRFIGAIKALATALMVIGSAIGPMISSWGIDAGITFPEQMIWYALYMMAVVIWTGFVVSRIRPNMIASA